MKKKYDFVKKMLILPKLKAMVEVVGGRYDSLRGNHKTKEDNMATENSKSYRYDRIEQAVVERIHTLADRYRESAERVRADHDEEGRWHEWTVSESQIDEEAYQDACQKFMDSVDDSMGSDELYWIFEIMLTDNFDYTPSQRNPYAIRKPNAIETDPEAPINPYKLMALTNRQRG